MTETTLQNEYLGLSNFLNKSNKLTDEETKMFFYIDTSQQKEWKLFAALTKDQKFLLCQVKRRNGISQAHNIRS